MFVSLIAVPPKPNSVDVQNRDQQSITVIWTRPGTCERSPFVKFYILFWCQLAKTDAECIFGKNIRFWSSTFKWNN